MKLLNSNYILFLKNPSIDLKKIETKGSFNKYKQFLFFDLRLFLLYIFLVGIISLLSEDFKSVFQTKTISEYPTYIKFLIYIFIAPIIEETAFRLGLKVNKINIAISLGFQLILLLVIFNVIQYQLWFRVLLVLPTIAIFYFLINIAFLNFLKNHFNYFVYYNILMFGILHTSNFTFSSFHQYFFIPVLIFSQLAGGAYYSYARIKYDFSTAIFFHILHNFIFVFPLYLFSN